MYLEYHHLVHWKSIKWHFYCLFYCCLDKKKMSGEESPCAKDLVPSYRHCWEMTGSGERQHLHRLATEELSVCRWDLVGGSRSLDTCPEMHIFLPFSVFSGSQEVSNLTVSYPGSAMLYLTRNRNTEPGYSECKLRKQWANINYLALSCYFKKMHFYLWEFRGQLQHLVLPFHHRVGLRQQSWQPAPLPAKPFTRS